MAQDRTVATREHGRHPACLSAEHRMPDRVHLWPHDVQPPTPQPMLNRTPSEAKRAKLRARYDPVLPLGKPRDPHIERIRLPNAMTVMGFGNRIGHGREFAAAGVTHVRVVLRGGG